jgi:hypothetical protein
MTATELRELLQVMQEFDVTSLRLNDCEVVREARVTQKAAVEEEKRVDFAKQLDETKSIMRLDDEALLNRMFPEETEESLAQ